MNEPGPQESMYDVSHVRVGSDIAGALAVIATFLVMILGVPPVKYFVAAAFGAGAICAFGLSLWHRRHPTGTRPENSLRADDKK